jgi:hypothetical protein
VSSVREEFRRVLNPIDILYGCLRDLPQDPLANLEAEHQAEIEADEELLEVFAMAEKLTGKALAKFEAERDVWKEVLDGVKEIKAGGGKRTRVQPTSEVVRVRRRRRLS